MPEPVSVSTGARFKPFLLGEALAIHEQSHFHPETVGDVVPVLVSDDVLRDHRPMRTVLRDSYAPNWKHVEGGGNFVDYYDCRTLYPAVDLPLFHVVRHAIRHFFQVDTRLHGPGISSNWFLQIKGRRSDFAIPHSDHDARGHAFTVIHFLNDEAECGGGTAFFRHRATGDVAMRSHQRDAFYGRHPALREDGRNYWHHEIADSWEPIGTVEMKPGRTIIFPAEFFHAAYHPDDRFRDYPRVNLVHWERDITATD
jgi:hypothetical protein